MQPPIKVKPTKLRTKIIFVLSWLRIWGRFVLSVSKNILLLFVAYLPTTTIWIYLYWGQISIVWYEITF